MLKKLVWEEEGQGMVEYGLILALIAVALIAVLGGEDGLGAKLAKVFTDIKTAIDANI